MILVGLDADCSEECRLSEQLSAPKDRLIDIIRPRRIGIENATLFDWLGTFGVQASAVSLLPPCVGDAE